MSIETVLRFAQLGLPAPILQAIDEIGYETPSPIQARSIPPMLEGRDLLGQAQTGTGKTAAFALPILCRVDPGTRSTQALVLTPTRELAIQVAEAIHAYARHLEGLHVLPIYGGQHIGAQLRPLQRGVHVVVGTPGRIIDHLDRGTLSLDEVRTVVLDEADEMLRMGFIEDVDNILGRTPSTRQIALYSATLPAEVRRIADRHLNDPAVVTIESATTTVETVEQRYLITPWRQKLDAMTRILETIDYNAMLIFVRTKVATMELSEKLEARGHACAALNGDMTQALRERTVQRLKDGALDIVVATDVAARGLDVSRITHVVNYDIPNDTEAYVHRIGRTGRAGREGSAILLVQPREKRMLRAIERATGQTITPMPLPSTAAVTDRRVTRFKQAVNETIQAQDLEFFGGVLRGLADEQGHTMETIGAALAFLVQQERPLQVPDDPAERLPRRPRSSERPERVRRDEIEPRDRREDRAPRRDDDRGRERDRRQQPAVVVRRVEPGRSGPLGPPEEGMERYRLEVGHEHGAQPKHIVGAIANETGLEGRDIGRIKVHDFYSVVDLPEGMPKPILRHLQTVEILGHPLRATALRERNRSRDDARSFDHPARGGHGKRDKNGSGGKGIKASKGKPKKPKKPKKSKSGRS